MPLNKELIDILACPKCKGPLTLRPDESAFECPRCQLAYAVTDDIPNFIIEEAQPLVKQPLAK
ncbi:MAG TPA: Trm112 family protein [Polyangia bacterium]|nr:Trm112 family protein [Polyangia bacterium]